MLLVISLYTGECARAVWCVQRPTTRGGSGAGTRCHPTMAGAEAAHLHCRFRPLNKRTRPARPTPAAGATAAFLTTQQLTGATSTRADLAGRAVGTWTKYVDRLAKEGIPAVGMRWCVPLLASILPYRPQPGALA